MWHKLFFNLNNVKGETARATVIQLPNRSDFKGCTVFHPTKLVREEGHNGYLLSMSFTDDWEWKVYKNREQIGVLDADDMVEIFDNPQLGEPTKGDSFLEITEPTKINEVVEVDESLKRVD